MTCSSNELHYKWIMQCFGENFKSCGLEALSHTGHTKACCQKGYVSTIPSTQRSKILDTPDDKCHLEPIELQAYVRPGTALVVATASQDYAKCITS